MKLRSIQLEQFKKFDEPVRIDGFADGLNLIAGPNEMGKSTLLLALRAALFERHSSKSQAIKALQPNHIQGAAPIVMVEFEMADGLYRVEKRFLRRPMARLTAPDGQVAEGNEAETALQAVLCLEQDESSPLDKGSPGHFGVMLIPQSQSFHQPKLARSTRHQLEEAITAEIEQLGNQSEVDAVLKEVEMSAFEIVDKRGKPKGRYKDVEARLEDLRKDIEMLQHDRDELSDDIDALNDADEQLRVLELAVEQDDLKAELDQLEGKRTELVRLKEIAAQIAAAKYRLDHLLMTRSQRQKKQAEQANLNAALVRLTEDETLALDQMAEVEVEQKGHQARREAQLEAENDLAGRRRALERLNTELNQRNEIENALQAIATEVTIELDDGVLDRVRLNDQPVDRATEVVQVVDGLDINIRDIGRIMVQPKVDDLKRLRDRRETLDNKIEALLDQLDLKCIDPEPIEIFWRETEEEASTLAASRAEVDEILADLGPRMEALRSATLALQAERRQIEERLVVLADEAEPDQAGDDKTDDELVAEIDHAEQELKEAERQKETPVSIEASLSETSPDPSAYEARIKTLRTRIEERVQQINEMKVTIGRLSAKVALRAGRGIDERLDDHCRRFDILSREQARYQLDAKALELLRGTLIDAANDAKTHFHAPLAAKLTPYIRSLLPETELEVTPDFGIAGLQRHRPGSETFDQLSDGTQEQIAILARLAFAAMLKERGLPALVVLDDALVFSDEHRLARMFGILENAALSLQIIILTCREDRFLKLDAKRLTIGPWSITNADKPDAVGKEDVIASSCQGRGRFAS